MGEQAKELIKIAKISSYEQNPDIWIAYMLLALGGLLSVLGKLHL